MLVFVLDSVLQYREYQPITTIRACMDFALGLVLP